MDGETINKKYGLWNYAIENGGILIGAFVKKEEKLFMNKAIEKGKKIIYISEKAYTDRQKPHKSLFEHCKKGNLLIISPEMNFAEPFKRRQECLFMNSLAERIAGWKA